MESLWEVPRIYFSGPNSMSGAVVPQQEKNGDEKYGRLYYGR